MYKKFMDEKAQQIFERLCNKVVNGEFDEDDIFKLEKYCIKYGIKNNKFKKDFIYEIIILLIQNILQVKF